MLRKTLVHIHLYEGAVDAFPFDDALKSRIQQRLEALYQPPVDVASGDGFRLEVQFGPPISSDGSKLSDDQLAADLAEVTTPGLPLGTWFSRILVARSSDREPDPYGVLFDLTGRHGCAIFVDAFSNSGFNRENLLVRTMAHELGHVFNLAHEDAGEEDPHQILCAQTLSESVNSPEISPDCWEHLLRHDSASVQPGSGLGFLTRHCPGHPFPASDGILAIAAPSRSPLVELRVAPGQVYPSTSEPTLVVGEPVHLTIGLTNRGQRAVRIPRWPTTATQELAIYRTDPAGQRTSLSAPLRFCATPRLRHSILLESGASAEFHETLHYRNGDLIFPIEGQYRLEAALRVGRKWFVSMPVTVRIAPPLKRRHESSSALAAHPELGRVLELGGGTIPKQVTRLARSNPEFPVNALIGLLAGRQAVLAPRKTPAREQQRLASLAAERTLPRVVRAEAELLLLLDRAQGGDRRAAERLRARLADPLHLPIATYPAGLIRRRLDSFHVLTETEEIP